MVSPHSHPKDARDRINKIDWIPNRTGPVSILLILCILSKTLDTAFPTTVRFPRELGSSFMSFFRYGMAVVSPFSLSNLRLPSASTGRSQG
jgi:hypothetical protein